jgi:hypothetical protein
MISAKFKAVQSECQAQKLLAEVDTKKFEARMEILSEKKIIFKQ